MQHYASVMNTVFDARSRENQFQDPSCIVTATIHVVKRDHLRSLSIVYSMKLVWSVDVEYHILKKIHRMATVDDEEGNTYAFWNRLQK